jgi:hypothetical protein
MTKQTVFLVVVILIIIIALVFARPVREPKAGGGAGYTHRLLPAGRGPHTHLAALSAGGDGTSTVDAGHSHQVHEFGVSPGPDGHVHDLASYTASA